MKKVLERIYLAFKVLIGRKNIVTHGNLTEFDLEVLDELFEEYKKKYMLIKDCGYPTDDEMIDYYDCINRNIDILDEIENECKKHLSNPSDYLFFLKDFYENERKDNV